MKKLISVLLLVFVVFGFVACDVNDTSKSSKTLMTPEEAEETMAIMEWAASLPKNICDAFQLNKDGTEKSVFGAMMIHEKRYLIDIVENYMTIFENKTVRIDSMAVNFNGKVRYQEDTSGAKTGFVNVRANGDYIVGSDELSVDFTVSCSVSEGADNSITISDLTVNGTPIDTISFRWVNSTTYRIDCGDKYIESAGV